MILSYSVLHFNHISYILFYLHKFKHHILYIKHHILHFIYLSTHPLFHQPSRTTFSLINNHSHLYLIPIIILGTKFKITHSIYYPLNHFQIHLFQIFSKRNKIVSLCEHPLEPPIIPIIIVGIQAIINETKRCKHKIFRKS